MIRTIPITMLALALAAASAHADVLALVVTNNHSAETGRPELHYADDDGAKYYDLFRMLGGEDQVELLTELDRDSERLFPDARAHAHAPTKAEVQAATARLAEHARAAARAGHPTELYFVFAGHGDVDHGRGFLELRDGRLTSEDLERILRDIGPTRAHVILDSCNSFFVLSPRKPGGHQIAVTEQAAQSLSARLPNVGVFLSTSAEAEVFEWSELQGGIFSHAVRSGLAGAADVDHDGHVSYDELRAFVEIATSRVKNPLYRPKVFARGPGGHGDATIFDATSATAKRIEIAGGARVTVRDPDELAWIDLHSEPGRAVTLLLPERWGLRASVDDHAAGSSLAARGTNELLSTLFEAPFGPQAYAQWQDQLAHQPPEVFGVSGDDAERMRLLLAQVARSERSSRQIAGAGLLGIGAITALSGSYLASQHLAPPGELVSDSLLACGALGLGGGVVALWRASNGERLYDSYVARMSDPATDKARVVAETESRLAELAADWRRTRHTLMGGGIAIAAISGAWLVASERAHGVTDQVRAQDRAMFAGTALIGGLLVLSAMPESPVERMHDLWIQDPDLSRLPRFDHAAVDVSLSPAHGGLTLGLSGRF
jgi:hypothetical protein